MAINGLYKSLNKCMNHWTVFHALFNAFIITYLIGNPQLTICVIIMLMKKILLGTVLYVIVYFERKKTSTKKYSLKPPIDIHVNSYLFRGILTWIESYI